MKLIIDTKTKQLVQEADCKRLCFDLYSKQAFEVISELWLKIGWSQKYTYTFTWMGRPIIQLPEDLMRIQEVIYQVKPDVIIETGIAHGGSLVYYASLCKVLGKGRVIGIDIEIRPHNRSAIESHELFPLITLIESNSIEPSAIEQVKSMVKPGEIVMVILDSCHTKQHILAELEAYHHLLTPGSYIIVLDGIMKDLYDIPRGSPQWIWDNPGAAAAEFTRKHPEFFLEQPSWPFNESELTQTVTHWPNAWLRKIR